MIWLAQLAQDFRYAVRGLRHKPALSAVAVLCLSVGIAADTTVFSVFDAILLQPLPFPHPHELVRIRERNVRTGQRAAVSYRDYRDWRERATAFAGMGAYSGRAVTVTEGKEPERVGAALVSSDLFPMLGVSPRLGRGFGPDDDRPGAAPTVLLGSAFWLRRFGGDSTVVGRSISVDGRSHTVIGVMPSGMGFPANTDLWMPIGPVLGEPGAEPGRVAVMARLAADVPLGEAAAEIAQISRPPDRAVAADQGAWEGDVTAVGRGISGSEERVVTTAMMGAVSFLLLIACANVANLLLTRAATRKREMAVRAAMGAGRGRVIRQLLTEAAVLGLVSAAVALPLVWEGLRLVKNAIPPSDPFPWYVDWSMDGGTLVYAAGTALLTSAFFGAAPAWHVVGGSLQSALTQGAALGAEGRRGRRVRDVLVIGEMALALVLLVGASIFVRQFLALDRVELGYDMSRLMTMRFYLPGAAYDSLGPRQRVVEDIVRGASEAPAVAAATISDLIPLDDEGGSYGPALVEGGAFEPGREPRVFYAAVAGDWFATFDVQLEAGRTFRPEELAESQPVAVVNRTMADALWPDDDPLGRRFRLAEGPSTPWLTVVGVAPDIRTVKLDESRVTPSTAYLPHGFVPTRDYALIARTRGAPASAAAALTRVVHGADPHVPVFNVWTMDRVHWLSFWMYGLWGTVFTVFGVVALLLATIGVYGVIYYSVAQRTREVGVRVAVGATRSRVIAMVVREAMIRAGLGILLGLAGALALTRVVSSLLIGVSATDIGAFASVAAGLTLVALVASLMPARRAASVDPAVALRAD